MAPRVEITDRDGWRKEFPLERALLHVGSDARNDIVLDARRGGGVATRHLQIVALAAEASRFRVINLSDREIPVETEATSSLPPRSAIDISDGHRLQLGDFGMVFRLDAATGTPNANFVPSALAAIPAASASPMRSVATPAHDRGVERTSSHIGLKLSLPQVPITPDHPLEGTITVQNLGRQMGVQFRLEVEGLNPDWYDIGPGPILFPQVEKQVPLRIHHPRGPGLDSGRHPIQIHASAPDAYPGERVSVSHEIVISPYYTHTLSLAAME